MSAVIGGVTASAFVRRFGEQTTLGLGLVATGLGLAGWLTSSLALVLAGEVVLGAGLPWAIVAFYTLLQRSTPGRLMGRVSSACDVLVGVPQTAPIAAGGVLVAVVDYRVLVVVMVAVLISVGGFLFVRRTLDDAAPTPTARPVTDTVSAARPAEHR